jgi:branched-chain amino acid transport system substrate-binding protein
MHNTQKRAQQLAVLVFSTAFALSCAHAQEAFKIGFSAPMSGPFGGLGKAEAEGVKIALDEMGNKFDNTPVESKLYDDKNDPAAAVAVAQEAMQRDKLNLLIGPVFTGTAAATMQLFTNGKLPQFIVGSATSVIDPKFPYAFRLNYPSPYQAALLVGYATGTLKKTKIGIMIVKDALGAGEVAAATEELAKRNLKPVGVEEMNTGSTDVTGQLQRLKKAGAEVMYIYASGADAATVVNGMQAVGLNVPIVGHAGMVTAGFRKLMAGKDISQLYATANCPFVPPQGTPLSPEVAAFVAKVKKVSYQGGDITEYVAFPALMYDAVYVAREGYRKAGNKADPDSLVKGIKAITGYKGLMGTVDFSKSNEGWPIENITLAKVDTFDPKTGTFTRAPGAVCGVPKT